MVPLVNLKSSLRMFGKTFRDVGIDFRFFRGRFYEVLSRYQSTGYNLKNPDLLACGLRLVRQGKEYV